MRLLALTHRSRDLDVLGHEAPDEPGELPGDGDDAARLLGDDDQRSLQGHGGGNSGGTNCRDLTLRVVNVLSTRRASRYQTLPAPGV